MNENPIVIVEDDADDTEIIKEAFNNLKIKNELIVFTNGFKFLEYMSTTENKTFFILCDLNFGIISGAELKRKISEDARLRLKCIPFLMSSTNKASASIMEAYSFGVQGYFVKPDTMKDYTAMLEAIMAYWNLSQHPD